MEPENSYLGFHTQKRNGVHIFWKFVSDHVIYVGDI